MPGLRTGELGRSKEMPKNYIVEAEGFLKSRNGDCVRLRCYEIKIV